MKRNIYVFIVCILAVSAFASCDNNNESTEDVKNEIRVKVYNTSTWNSVTNSMDTVVGATVNLISDAETISAKTDNNGIATFSGVKENGYSLIASQGDLCNLINKSTKGDTVIGNLIIGVYSSQADIENSANYSKAVVGGCKLDDVNRDGLINDNDKITGGYLDFEYKYKDLNNDGVIDVKDLLNGRLVELDNIVEYKIYIGK